jgi:hypothetical protein
MLKAAFVKAVAVSRVAAKMAVMRGAFTKTAKSAQKRRFRERTVFRISIVTRFFL